MKNNNNNTFFIQGNSVSYFTLAAIKRSPVTKDRVKSYKDLKAYSPKRYKRLQSIKV